MDDDKEFDEVPKFGNSKSSFEDVVNFYGFWESYSTKKTYVWLFTHDISEIRDRRILKHVDKEHKKIQQKARKERNEEVRSLVLFCKKRDKRMQEYRKLLEEKAQQNRLKSEQNRLDQIRKRNEELREQQENSKVSSEMQEQIRQLEENYFNQYDSDNSISEDEDESDAVDDADGDGVDEEEIADHSDAEAELIDDELYCVACNKFFNSESSKKNHDASKKHRTNVELLRKQMQKDEENFKQSSDTKLEDDKEDVEMINSEEECIEILEKKSKKSKKKKMQLKDHKSNSDEEVEDLAELLDTTEISSMPIDEKVEEEDDWSTDKKPKKVKSNQNQNNKEKRTKAKKKTEIEDQPDQPSSSSRELNDAKLSNTEPSDEENRCATCGQSFPSKNKLFDHLKKTKHSVYLGDKKVDAPKKAQRKNK